MNAIIATAILEHVTVQKDIKAQTVIAVKSDIMFLLLKMAKIPALVRILFAYFFKIINTYN